MGSKPFLIINGLIAVFLIIRLLSARKVDRPTPLSLEQTRPPSTPITPPKQEFHYSRQTETETVRPTKTAESGPIRSLNCSFEHGGQTWDAFDVLGVPAGSTKDACIRAMVDIRRNGHHKVDFLTALWNSLEKHFQG